MDVCIKYLDRKVELTGDVEVDKENSRMGFIDVTYKCTDKTLRKRIILNFAAIESIVIVEEE